MRTDDDKVKISLWRPLPSPNDFVGDERPGQSLWDDLCLRAGVTLLASRLSSQVLELDTLPAATPSPKGTGR